MTEEEKPQKEKAGYLIVRLKSREGLIINDVIEIRIAQSSRSGYEAQLAIRAPKEYKIRFVK